MRRQTHDSADTLDRIDRIRPSTALPAHGARGRGAGLSRAALAVSAAALAVLSAAGCLLCAPPLWAVAQTSATVLTADVAFVGLLVRLVLGTLALGVCLTILVGVRSLWHLAEKAGLVQLPGAVPVAYADVRRAGAGLAQQLAAAHFAVQGRMADAAAVQVPAHYAPTISYRAESRQDVPPAEAAPTPAPVAAPLDPTRLLLPQLLAKSWTRPEAWFVGCDPQGAPLQLDLALTGMVAVSGQPRSGKTTTALGLMAQAAYQGAALFVCDPHARVAHGLLHRATLLSGHFERQAVTDAEIAHVIGLVAKIARRRLDGQDQAAQPVLLVIDEFTTLVARRALAEDVLAALLAVAVEAPKVQVHGLLLAQDWSARLLGPQIGASLRRVVTHRLVHRGDPGNADFLLPSAVAARQVATLERGTALFWPADGRPTTITVPDLGREAEVRFAARGRAPRPYAPRPSLPAPVSAPVQPAARSQAPALTLAGRITALLADGAPRDSLAIAAALGEDKGAVQAALTKLGQAGAITRQGAPRQYTYTH